MTNPATKFTLNNFKYDAIAGTVVFLVAIPLCLGIALASGAPLFAGIISGIIGGIVVGSLSESDISVSGPAAGMVAVIVTAIGDLGSFNAFLLALMLAGILQITIGSLRAGFVADYVPSNVIQGLLCAIGILIIIKQLPFALFYTDLHSEVLSSVNSAMGSWAFHPLKRIHEHLNPGAIIITTTSILLLIFFDKTKNTTLRKIPGPIVVVVLEVMINYIFSLTSPKLVQYNGELVNLPVFESLKNFFAHVQTPLWSQWINPKIYLHAFILAAVASLEALLNLEGVEKLDKSHRYCSRNRELIAQGMGNTLSGLVGGLPITSVIVRSSVNIQAGAKTKMSAIIHGILLLLVVMLIPRWMNAIPLAALAGILLYVGYKLTRPIIYREMYQQGWSRFAPFIITVVAIVSMDLLTGVIIGLLTGFFFILKENSQIQLNIVNEIHPSGEIKRLILPEQMSFLRKAALVQELKQIPANSKFIVDARHTRYMDKDIIEVLEVYRTTQAPLKDIHVNLINFKEHYEVHDHIDFINVTTYDVQSALTPEETLEILREGNSRFATDNRIHRNLPDEIKAVSTKQHPIAIVLACIDSRVPVETVFDMGVGDLFVARVAGNVVNDDVLASMEFACHVAGAKLIVVLGHTYCGAIQAACNGAEGGHLTELLNKIKPAIEAEKKTTDERNGNNQDFLRRVTSLNIHNAIKHISTNSDILKHMINDKKVGLIGALYDIKTGMVTFHEELHQQ